jgi:signal peptidase II
MQERWVVVTALRVADQQRVRRLLIPVVAGMVVAADQVSKTWALHHVPALGGRHIFGPVWLVLTFNSGAAFSLGRGVQPVVETVVIVLVVWLLALSRRASRIATLPTAIGLGLLLGGAIGNLSDRVLRHHHGAVIDFVDALRVGTHDWWPVFNVADASIVVGVLTVVLSYVRRPTGRAGGADSAPGDPVHDG